jgi:hypothetical protein
MLIKKIAKIRLELQNSKLKKSGKNSHAGFTYYELSDFLPRLNELMSKEEITDIITIENGLATLVITDGKEERRYSIPFQVYDTPSTRNGSKMMQDIQYLGALNTYYKRYLYLNAFGITDGEVIDKLDNTNLSNEVSESTIKAIINSLAKIETQEALTNRWKKLQASEQKVGSVIDAFTKRKGEINEN